MKGVIRHVIVAALFLVAFAAPASAQYMYLDSNGDGIHTAADVLSPNGTATTVDIYLDTNSNADGSDAVCNIDDTVALTINSYVVNLDATGGTVTYSNYINQRTAYTITLQAFTSNTDQMAVGFAQGTPDLAGTYRLGTVTITGESGSPSIGFADFSALGVNGTSFGTLCPGQNFDNTYQLGLDWSDTAGLGAAAGGNAIPSISAPATASGIEGVPITISASASDLDATDNVTITAVGFPSSLTLTSTPGTGSATATITGTPGFADQGSSMIIWTATDGTDSTTTTTNLTIANVDRAPVVTAPATVSGTTGTLVTFTVSATDPDGEGLIGLTAAPLPTGATFTANATNTAGTFSWTPTAAQTGTFNVTFTALNALSGSASTQITIAGADEAPIVSAPSTAAGATSTLITFVVSATDPNGDAITSFTAAPLPAGATFTTNAANTSGTFNWTPTAGQTGTFDVTFTASNALSGSDNTVITVTDGDLPPVVTAPATASGDEGSLITIVVTANDPDGDPIDALVGSFTGTPPFPSGAVFTANATNTSGTFTWTPSFDDAGTYTLEFRATNALTGAAITTLTVNNVDRAPEVTAPTTITGTEGVLTTFTVTATDPDGDAITSLDAASLPTGATFTANASNTSGTFSWIPGASQAGSYTVTFVASNALSDSATTDITIENADVAPTVTAPATITGSEGVNINFTVTAADDDGDAITSLTAAPLPAGATFTANATNTSGTFDWTPAAGQAGSYSVTFTASNAQTGSATTAITVAGTNNDPIVTAPASQTTDEGVLLTFTVTATDADGNPVALSAVGLPAGATFVDNGDNTGTFTWTPAFNQSGSYSVTFNGSDGQGGTGSATTTITVNDVNRAPTADADGPYSGVIDVPITFDGSGSSDPDGDALEYAWDFGDGSTGTGVSPTHAYAAGGLYNVVLTVTDPDGLSDVDSTTATVSTSLSANAFTVGGNKTTSLGSGKPYTCVQLEPVGGSFTAGDVVLSSITMSFTGGTVAEISADASKTTVDGDRNGNGVGEITACFTKDDLRLLFSGLSPGRNTVTATIEGDLVTGGSFSAPVTMVVKATGNALAATITPNPLNPRAKLTFATSKPGAIRVQMFDPQGRLVKTIADRMSEAAGYHDFEIDGKSANGTKLASGVYFVKVWSQYDGQEVKSITILK